MIQVGKRIYTQVDRPARELVEAFRSIPSSNIGDMMNRMFNMNADIKAYLKGSVMVGTAITVHAPEGDNMLFHRALDIAQPGDIIVVNAGGSMSRALCGEMMFTYAKGRGITGMVVDGCIRDVDSLEKLRFPVYAKGVTPQGPWKYGPGEINTPIACGGQVVFPGDIIVGDGDGIVVIRPQDAEEILAASQEKFHKEEQQLIDYHSGEFHQQRHQETYSKLVGEKGVVTL